MRASFLLPLSVLAAACAPPRPRGFASPAAFPAHPEPVVAADVPALPGFSTAVKVGTVVYLSGQVPLDSAGRLVGRDDLARQASRAFLNLARVIRAAHGVPADLAKLTVYVVGYDTSAVATVRGAVEPYLDPEVPAALTIVGVATLPEPGMRIAMDGIAILRGQLPDRTRDRGP
jgi:enamine deaminase RidA (YjgF/YER057c/UK114 family)